MAAAGLEPLSTDVGQLSRTVYRGMSKAAHHQRSIVDEAIDPDRRTMIYGPDPRVRQQLEFVIFAGALIQEVLIKVGDALSVLWGPGFYSDHLQPMLRRFQGNVRCSRGDRRGKPSWALAMRIALNIIWLILAGLWSAIAWCLAGLLMCVLIITIPFGLQAFKIASFTIWPFGRTLVRRPDAGAASAIGNIIWFVFAGWWLAVMHLIASFLLAITIIGIPWPWPT